MISHKALILSLSLFTLSGARAMDSAEPKQPEATQPAAAPQESDDAIIARFAAASYGIYRRPTLPQLKAVVADADKLLELKYMAVYDPQARSRRIDIARTKGDAQKLLDDGKYAFSMRQ